MSDMASNTPFLQFKTTGADKQDVEVYFEDLIDYCIMKNWFDPSKETEATRWTKPEKAMGCLRASLSPAARAVYIYSLGLSEKDQSKPRMVINTLKEYYGARIGVSGERQKLLSLLQNEKESIASWETRIRNQAAQCEYEKFADELMRDQFIAGLRSEPLRVKLIGKGHRHRDTAQSKVTLREVVEVAKNHEATTFANQLMKNAPGIQQEQVNFLKKTALENRSPDTLTAACFWCRGDHPSLRQQHCPAFGKRCNKCGIMGHFARACRGGSRTGRRRQAAIRQTCFSCGVCSQYLSERPQEPMQSHIIPSRPWERVSADLFQLDGSTYLVLVDHYSDYYELDPLRNTSAVAVIRAMKRNFARHGIPDECVTDNGPQFDSHEYARFAREYEFTSIKSSPYHSKGNGKAESAVKIAKNILKKSRFEDPYLALLAYRNTPQQGYQYSPGQRLMSRKISFSHKPHHDRM